VNTEENPGMDSSKIDDFIKQGQAFAESHKFCKKEQEK